MAEAVVDSSALLALLWDEPGGMTLAAYPSMLMCAVNHCEVVGKLLDRGTTEAEVSRTLQSINCRIEPLTAERAFAAAALRRHPALRAISLGDRACLALALQVGLPVLTADRAWANLDIGVEVRLIR